jgi:hypothetical protein
VPPPHPPPTHPHPRIQVANMRMPTAAGTAYPGTSGGMGNGDVRPMTSVRGAGYSSGPAGGGGGAKPVFDPFQQGGTWSHTRALREFAQV